MGSIKFPYRTDAFADAAARKETPPMGAQHIHFRMRGATKKQWIVCSRRSPLCGTPRCRLVTITERE